MKELIDFLSEIDALDEKGQKKLDDLIENTSELKQLPVIARKIMQVVEDPKSTAGHLERVIQSDQALTTKLLKIANSSFYGLLRKVNTLQRSILVVGFKAIKDIAVSTAILNMYRSSDPFSIKLFEQAICSGIATRILSLEFDKTDTEEAFVGGLLHNVGKNLLLRANSDEIHRIYKEASSDPDFDELAAEREVFGFCHTHAGGSLTQKWNLSKTLEAMIRYHHHLSEVLWSDLDLAMQTNIALVAYSDRFCRFLGIGCDKPDPIDTLLGCPEQEFLKLSDDRIKEIAEEVKLAYFSESQLFS